MSTLTPIKDLGIDWTGSTTVVHASTDPDTGGTDVQCPCGWRRLIGETASVIEHEGAMRPMPRSVRAAREHADTHHGDVYLIVRDALGEIVREWWA